MALKIGRRLEPGRQSESYIYIYNKTYFLYNEFSLMHSKLRLQGLYTSVRIKINYFE